MECFQMQKLKSFKERKISGKKLETSRPTVGLKNLSFYQILVTISVFVLSSVYFTDQSNKKTSPSSEEPVKLGAFYPFLN